MKSLEGQYLGSYELQECIGQGGFGAVYRAIHQRLRTNHALKLLHPHVEQEASFRKRFEREAQLMAQLRHPHLMRVTDFCTDEEHGCYFVMDLLEGEPLSARLQKERIPLEELRVLFGQLCDALHYIHQRDVFHRDIKPGNIFLAREGGRDVAKLLDFGVAAWRKEASLTQSGAAVGSMLYIAPEQLEDAKSVDGRADLYSLAILFHECLAGKAPFQSDSIATLIKNHLLTPPPTLKESAPNRFWCPELESFLQKSLEKEPEQRFAGASQFWVACEAALGAQSTYGETAELSRPQLSVSSAQAAAGEAETLAPSLLGLGETKALARALVTAALDSDRNVQRVTPKDTADSFSHKVLTGERVSFASAAEKGDAPFATKLLVVVCGLLVVFLLGWVGWQGWGQLSDGKQSAKNQLPTPQRTSMLSLYSVPSGASVWGQGRLIAKTPCSLQGTRGETRRFVLKHKGFRSTPMTWTFGDARGRARLRLKPASRIAIALHSKPAGATIWRGDVKIGVTPHKLLGPPGQSWTLRLTALGYREKPLVVRFVQPAQRVMSVLLSRLFVLTLQTQPGGALVVCRHGLRGQTPLRLARIRSEGVVHCKISKAGFLQETVRWSPRSHRTMTLQLRRPF